MKIKSITAQGSGQTPFGPLPTKSPSTPNLAKEAKRLNNQEKGKAADEKYLGEEQNVTARVLRMLEPQSVYFPDHFDDPDDIPWEP